MSEKNPQSHRLYFVFFVIRSYSLTSLNRTEVELGETGETPGLQQSHE